MTELRRLRYFLAVAEERSVTRAAERLHIAQPALSRQIKQLEQELGVQLPERGAQGVGPTRAGAVPAGRGAELCARAVRLWRDVRLLRPSGSWPARPRPAGGRIRVRHRARTGGPRRGAVRGRRVRRFGPAGRPGPAAVHRCAHHRDPAAHPGADGAAGDRRVAPRGRRAVGRCRAYVGRPATE
ncbi:helix-turn-helix domain-containing protein [Kitasatospora paranensis]|uniref:helix-turn-helix domain-containing protein n=1 Tax=Kitasatospora paranensis TaxID=258053 RepID=UPI003CD0A581